MSHGFRNVTVCHSRRVFTLRGGRVSCAYGDLAFHEVFVEGERMMTRATGEAAIDSVTIRQGGRETAAARLP